ncbi:type I-E CRISPR-associated protein Cas6/Cse3/CasE [Actinoalloteichus hymeniacidonis]|uniref:CRISPR-associated protein Cas6/Cse3/CasE, subtype I-E/ECOLI n=1 Tax=Actinoalloteichus hymeniacidonis TaxID=340345 RepID=A0AAC9HUM0_9PSEU|nr:type I-E CRISPR-associated protein Cas6/Cse3/CasE [Actinoalloteichus hymeniacidonis]AOS64820.1 CRISPR-associated protein Cas6/Cse3/CasE, subtype I-E/ECOLI [Actinoalloteichus hymeniacidonis]MBB5907105.1 CRISPR system Cascade subunit CasE [Actinoalloteichus hymeniacidonis]
MTIWLTRIQPNLRNPRTRADLHDFVGLHRTVMSLFPERLGEAPRRQAGALFRVDSGPAGDQLLVQSSLRPEATRLPADYGTVRTTELTALLAALSNGMAVHYRLVANTSKRLAKDNERYRRGQLVALKGGEVLEWWQRRSAQHGLALASTEASAVTTPRSKDRTAIRHARTRFQGVATVSDVELLREAVLTGVGRARAYGCGLLSVVPVKKRA